MPRILLLLDPRGRRHAVPLDAPVARVRGLGTIRTADLETRIGRRIEVGGRPFLVLEPAGRDYGETMDREAQTLALKDIAILLFDADIRPGARVVEAGTGSGRLTVALARAVGPAGHVTSYDMREEAHRVARANVAATSVEGVIEFRLGDIRQGIPEREVDAMILDLVDPWAAVETAWIALRPCGHLASFSPNMEQVKQTVAAIRARPFVDVRTIEVIEREMEVREVGVRPSFAPLGHTGYLTFARKVLDTF